MKENLTFLQQAELFQKRGIEIENLESAASKLETISYYKLKEFAEPFNINKNLYNIEPKYIDITFEDVIKRYYQDKNLRIYLMHALEKIEVSFKTRIAYNLGNIGAYGYLNESSWMDRENNYQNKKKVFQSIFDKHSKENSYKTKIDFKRGAYVKEAPSVWIFINSLTFGEIVKIYECMSKKRKREIAKYYKLDYAELELLIKSLRLIRNLCAHNNKIIDIKYKSLPKIRDEWSKYLIEFDKNDSCHLALVILIIKYFIDIINPAYKYKEIFKTVKSIIDGSDVKAMNLGFKNKYAFKEIFRK